MEWYKLYNKQMVKIYPKANSQANHQNQQPYAEDIMHTSKNTLKSSQKTMASSNISKCDPSIYPKNWDPQGQSADIRASVVQNKECKAEEQEQQINFPEPGLLKKESAQFYRFGQKQANKRNQLIKIRNKQDVNEGKLVVNKNEEDTIRVFNVKQQEKSQQIPQDLLICQICYEQVPVSYFENLGCGHSFCWNCVCSLLQESSNTSRPLRCPNQNCKRMVKIQQLSFLQKLPQQKRKKIKKDSLFLSLSNKQTQFLCPNQNCDDGIINIKLNNNPLIKQVKCNKCLSPYCSQCLQPPHPQQQACKNWRDEFNVIQYSHNYCRCQKCLNIIEKADGCMHMTCKCGYQFCFRCGNRWRKFHYCNPFRFHQYKRDVLEDDSNQPKCSDYAEYVGLEIGKGFWTVFVVFYLFPFLVAGLILGVIGIVIGILCAGISYGYYLVLLEDCIQRSICKILLHSIIFPLGMIQGVFKIGQAHYYKICQLSMLILRGADVLLPFNCIPFECLT